MARDKMLRRVRVILLLIMAFSVLGSGCEKQQATKEAFEIKPTVIQEETKYLTIDVKSPELSGVPGIERINEEIQTKLNAAIAEVQDAAKAIEENPSFPPNWMASLNGDYQYFHNGDVASVWTNFDNYLGGAHGMYWINSYTFNTENGEQYGFKDLFVDDIAGPLFVQQEILKGKEDPMRGYFDTAEETIASYNFEYPFLINGNELIVYFPLYEIAPYAAGMQAFAFPLDEISSYLKPDLVAAMQGQTPVDIPYLSNFGSVQ